jgi:hypothetical protein
MSTQKSETMDTSTVYTMFEEIKDKITQQSAAQPPAAPVSTSVPETVALDAEDKTAMETLTEKLDTVSEQLAHPLRHHHTLDFMGNRALIALVIATAGLIAAIWIIDHQRQTLANFRDNDLKYRYIQMRGEATPADILQLRNIFDFNRNPDSIRIIRRQVVQYEQLIQEQAENEARAKLNAFEAERLNSEAETVKGGK